MPNFALMCVLCVIAASGFPLEEIGRNAAALRRNVRQNNKVAAQPKQRLKLSDLYTDGFINNVLKDETKENGKKGFKSDEDNASSVEDEIDGDEDIDESEEDVKSISHEDVDEAKDDKGNESVAKSESEKSDENVDNDESEEDSRSPENVDDNKDEKENDSEDESKYFVYSGRDHTNHNHLVNDFFNFEFDDDDADDEDFDYVENAEDFDDGYENYEDDDYIHNENNNGVQSEENRSNNNELQSQNGNGIEFDNNFQDNEIGNSIEGKHEVSFVPEEYHRHHFSHQPSGGEFSLRTNRINTGIQKETNFDAHKPMGNDLGLGHKFPKDVVNW